MPPASERLCDECWDARGRSRGRSVTDFDGREDDEENARGAALVRRGAALEPKVCRGAAVPAL
ncbi:MAG: hypothetical protein LBI59_03290, partial [Candidatus Accumulibacter sp.]|nr:hypothetical protein [Accumulibacter sp.]